MDAPLPYDPLVTLIEEALVDLSAERSFANTTLEMVLHRAEVGETVFRRHFASLEDCFCHIYERQRNLLVERIGAAFAGECGWRWQLRAAGQALLEFLQEDLRRARFMVVEVFYAGERARMIRDETMHGLALLIDKGRDELDDPSSLTVFTAETLSSAIYQRIRSAIERGELETLQRSVPELMYAAVLPYLGLEAATEELRIPGARYAPA